MSNVVKLRSALSNSNFNILSVQKSLLEKELFSIIKSINTNLTLIQELQNNIFCLKKDKVVVSLKEYKKILSELAYLNNNLAELKNVYQKNESNLKNIKKITEEKEGKLIKLPIKKTKRRKSKKD